MGPGDEDKQVAPESGSEVSEDSSIERGNVSGKVSGFQEAVAADKEHIDTQIRGIQNKERAMFTSEEVDDLMCRLGNITECKKLCDAKNPNQLDSKLQKYLKKKALSRNKLQIEKFLGIIEAINNNDMQKLWKEMQTQTGVFRRKKTTGVALLETLGIKKPVVKKESGEQEDSGLVIVLKKE